VSSRIHKIVRMAETSPDSEMTPSTGSQKKLI
jgi:hypothetical protein